jgi:YggT family protein
LIERLLDIVQITIYLLVGAIFIRIILSWVAVDPRNPLVTILHDITEPILAPIRQFMPRFGMLDLSPMVATILLILIANAIGQLGT